MPLTIPSLKPLPTEAARTLSGLGARGLRRVTIESVGAFASAAEAERAFREREPRLLTVAGWTALGNVGLRFALHDGAGCHKGAAWAAPGDFIAITVLPWLGPRWWVRVEAVERSPGHAAIVLRPSHDPTETPPRPERTAHFLSRRATLELSLAQRDRELVATAEGRDELANIGDECRSPMLALWNRLVTETGWGRNARPDQPWLPLISLQQRHWEAFTRHLLR